MKSFLKYLGVIILLIGVLFLAIPGFMKTTSNLTLSIGILLEIIGFVLHITFGKKAQE